MPQEIHDFLLHNFAPRFGQLHEDQGSHPTWQAMRDLGTELWLDTGNMKEIGELWTRQFNAVTTNNTLLNKEVQSGQYDEFIPKVARLLKRYRLDERRMRLEMAFVLNARHALRLVEKYDAYVSVEEHTDLAFDAEEALGYARRYYSLCPERFFVKIPFTPAGLLTTRMASREGIPVNHTLGFSARQNYVIARVAQPKFVNVFLGRLNSFVVENKLGDGLMVGEKATLASQRILRELRTTGISTRQIGASFRTPQQVRDLAGLDVMTIPASAAKGFLDLGLKPNELSDRTGETYQPRFIPGVDPQAVGLDSLWDISPKLIEAVDELERMELDGISPQKLVGFFESRGCGDFLVKWTPEQITMSTAEGKIPRLENWRTLLADKMIGLDSLMNLAGLCSFITDQKAMDDRVQQVLQGKLEHHSA